MTDNDNQHYEVEKILKKRTNHGDNEYLIKWKGYSTKYSTWEPTKNLENVWEMINEFENNQA